VGLRLLDRNPRLGRLVAHPDECFSGLCLDLEPLERTGILGVHRRLLWLDHAGIAANEHELVGRASRDLEQSRVRLLVVKEACDGEVPWIVLTAVLAVDDVVQIEAPCRSTAGHGAPVMIALHHQAARRRRNVRFRTLGSITVERPDVIRVARRPIDRGRR
jgi:hypothetical protein